MALQRAVPFVGFGFMDNAIMILAGDYIEASIGVTLGISTMAAAALGVLVADVLGLSVGEFIERVGGWVGGSPFIQTHVHGKRKKDRTGLNPSPIHPFNLAHALAFMQVAVKLGVPEARLTKSQTELWVTRATAVRTYPYRMRTRAHASSEEDGWLFVC